MFYNTTFEVKYFDIYKELTEKKKNENNDEYSLEDILDVCNKLYMDEYASVFYAEDILDDKIDIGMRKVLELMKENESFVSFLNEIYGELFGYDKELYDNNNNKQNNEDNQYYVFLSLFNYETFYLIHKIVCSQLNTSIINNDMLIDLKQIIVKSIHSKE